MILPLVKCLSTIYRKKVNKNVFFCKKRRAKGVIYFDNRLFCYHHQLSCKNENSTTNVTFARAFSVAAEYAQTHFRAEEEYLKQAGYLDLPNHKKEHDSFITEIWEQFRKYKEDNATPIGLPRFLKKWLLSHIVVKDKHYADSLRKL